MKMKFIVVNYGDDSVGMAGFDGEVIFNVDDGNDDADCLKENISGVKDLLQEIYGQEAKTVIYTEEEFEKYCGE